MNHKYSTYALIGVMTIILIGAIAGALTSKDLDAVCSDNSTIFYKIAGSWVCYDLFGGNNTWTGRNYFFGDVIVINSTITNFSNANFTGNSTFDTNVLFVDATNNRVGIGTTSPQNPLNVIGVGNFTGNLYSNGAQVLTSYSETDPYWTGNSSNVAFINKANTFGAFNQAFDTNTLFIDATNNRVGIGTTGPGSILDLGSAATGRRFHVYNGGGANIDGLGIDLGGNSYEYDAFFAYGASDNGRFVIGSHNGTTFREKVTVLGSGNVGIGTTSPTQMLSVGSGSPFTVTSTGAITGTGDLTVLAGNLKFDNNKFFYQKMTGGSSVPVLGISVDDKTYLLSGAGGDIVIKPENSVTAVTVKATTGNVGIGTTTPQNTLNVLGLVNSTGYIVNASVGYSGYCVNITYVGGIAVTCND